MKYQCPCCKYYTLPVPAREALAFICPVCFWEVDTFIQTDNEPSDQNCGLTLMQAQASYILVGACCKEMLPHVRLPEKDELQSKD